MVSSWLSRTAAALVCAVAISGAVARPATQASPAYASSGEDAEQLHFDALGNMLWPDEQQQAQVTQAAKAAQDAGARFGDEASNAVHDVYENLKHAVADKMAALEHQAKGWTASSGAARWADNLIHESSVMVEGAHCEQWHCASLC